MMRKKNLKASVKRNPRFIFSILVLLFVVVGSATFFIRERAIASNRNSVREREHKQVLVQVAKQDVPVQRPTVQVQPLTDEQTRQLAEDIKRLVNKRDSGLTEVREADGTVSMDLQGRYQNVIVARTNADGSVTHSCVDNPRAAANFFQIDPKLVGVEGKLKTLKPVSTTAARR